ncbi:hypothetical protein JY96_21325 [Aquabacterium sp. NJ1]|uniref:hypothetical protein n=1 Tax=Aquabacterium sp. NJ1 TaxID=1538295 RepID=UPI00052B6FB3|nr:hypothetical protein [Aquabacterium sp. NJ1]KGM38717.1 hypothetical protein JY96_21325 [Aquabacterium sp. NJ1]
MSVKKLITLTLQAMAAVAFTFAVLFFNSLYFNWADKVDAKINALAWRQSPDQQAQAKPTTVDSGR